MERIRGIDSIRTVCALIVLVGHLGLPISFILKDRFWGLGNIINSGLGVMFNGPAAVIVFFVISGFCIHYPNKNKDKINIFEFYTKRFIRIVLPALIACILWLSVGEVPKSPSFGVFWSVICEMIYYLLYPLLFYSRKKITWFIQIMLSMLIYIITHFDLFYEDQSYTVAGYNTWIIGLPCWILGCWLSENYNKFPVLALRNIWILRIGVYLVSVLMRVIKFHVSPPYSSNVFQLNIFAFIACIWLALEINYYKNNPAFSILEKAGLWSYSLYIIHPAIPKLITAVFGNSLNPVLYSSLTLIGSLIISYVFYLLVEKPFHNLAKKAGSYVKQKTSPVLVKQTTH